MCCEELDVISVAVVEDDLEEIEKMKELLGRYSKEYGRELDVSCFPDTVEFLAGYSPKYDILLMDIDMPYVNGMEAAGRIRTLDKTVIIVFVTNMPQFAIKGYSVQALDYILKPVSFYSITTVMNKAVNLITRDEDSTIAVRNADGVYRLHLSRILYIEVNGHKCVYHTTERDVEVYSPIKAIEEALPSNVFVRCSNAYIVNMNHVDFVDKDGIHVGDAVLTLSRPKRKEFIEKLGEFCGGM